MKRTILTTVIVIAAVGAAQAQQQTTYYKGQSKQDIVFGLLSSQYDSDNPKAAEPKTPKQKRQEEKEAKVAKAQTKTEVKKDAMQSAVVNDPTKYVLGEDKYLKTKEENKRYSEFQVFDIKGMDKNQVVLGMLTNTLDRGIRYNEKGDIDKKITVSTGYVDQLDASGKIIPGKKVAVSSLRIKDKVFVIIGQSDYRYEDGRKLVGDQKTIDEMIKGKPVTELTFYYELQKAGVLDKNISLKQFTKMALSEKQLILNGGTVATADY